MANVPYVGCRVFDSAAAMDKVMAKKLFNAAGIKQTPSVYVKKRFDGKFVVVNDDTTEDENVKDVILKTIGQYDSKILCEKAINATELECAVLGNDDVIASRVGQILPHGEFYTFESKYEDEQSATCIPARVDQSVQDYIRENAVKAFKALDGHGLARCDFFLDQDTNEVYLNEINTLPGFTNISMYPQLMKDLGIDTPELIDRLVALAFER